MNTLKVPTALIFAALLCPQSLYACKCARTHFGAKLNASKYVFLGKVLEVKKSYKRRRAKNVTFAVQETFKGQLEQTLSFENVIRAPGTRSMVTLGKLTELMTLPLSRKSVS